MSFLSFLMNNVWAKWVAIGVIVYGIMRTKEEVDERRGYRRAIERTEKQSRRVQKQVRENLNEKSTQTTDAVDTVRRRVRDTGELPEYIRERFIRPDGDS